MAIGGKIGETRIVPATTQPGPLPATVWHGRSSGDDALWSDIAFSDVVRVAEPTQDSTIGRAQDQGQARRHGREEASALWQTSWRISAWIGATTRHSVHLQPADGRIEHVALEQNPAVLARVDRGAAAAVSRREAGRSRSSSGKARSSTRSCSTDCFVLYPINPKALARYREAFRTSGAKDDPLDSELLLDLVVRHRDQLRAWVPDTVETRLLQGLCEQRRKLVNQRVALTNRLTSLLKQYFPHALEWIGDVASGQACDFLTRWPTLAAVQRARPSTLRQFYRAHNCRQAAVIDARLAAIARACPLTTDAAVVEPLRLAVQTYATQLRALLAAIQTFDDRIAGLFATHADHDVFRSFPGAGAVCAPRLAAAFGTDRSRWTSAAELQALLGHCARHRTEWQNPVGASSVGLSQIREADLS